MAKRLKSIFTERMSQCIVTHALTGVEIHHVFGGANRKRSEKYGFVVPLHRSVHPNGAFLTDKNWLDLDHWLKRKCQEYYLEVALIGDRDSWYREFGRFWDDRCNENVYLDKTFEWRV